MKFIKTENGIYLNAATIENLQVEDEKVVAWVQNDNQSPYDIKIFDTAEKAELYLAMLVAKLGDVTNAGV
ncbi:MAG: hypothetical protein IJQ01_06200 [Selenomonadaceae bacterium]|nr:hypothetical protein [Selenomonadaceae bacterium]